MHAFIYCHVIASLLLAVKHAREAQSMKGPAIYYLLNRRHSRSRNSNDITLNEWIGNVET